MPCSMKWKVSDIEFQRRAKKRFPFWWRRSQPKKSHTFRSGKTGGWREHFNDEHKKLFKDVTGGLLVKLEYEKDNDW